MQLSSNLNSKGMNFSLVFSDFKQLTKVGLSLSVVFSSLAGYLFLRCSRAYSRLICKQGIDISSTHDVLKRRLFVDRPVEQLLPHDFVCVWISFATISFFVIVGYLFCADICVLRLVDSEVCARCN